MADQVDSAPAHFSRFISLHRTEMIKKLHAYWACTPSECPASTSGCGCDAWIHHKVDWNISMPIQETASPGQGIWFFTVHIFAPLLASSSSSKKSLVRNALGSGKCSCVTGCIKWRAWKAIKTEAGPTPAAMTPTKFLYQTMCAALWRRSSGCGSRQSFFLPYSCLSQHWR